MEDDKGPAQGVRRPPGRSLGPGTVGAAMMLVLACVCPLARSGPPPTLDEAFGRLPLLFEPGAPDRSAAFVCRSLGYRLALQSAAVRIELPSAGGSRTKGRDSGPPRSVAGLPPATLTMRLSGANPDARGTGLEQLPTKVNYLLGNDPSQWRVEVPTFARVRFAAVYPGIDVVYYGNPQHLEYDFVVQPGARPEAIGLEFDGAEALSLNEAGDLLVTVGGQTIRFRRPSAYQEGDGGRDRVRSGYRLEAARRVRLDLGEYDPHRVLIVDPVLVYGAHLGGGRFDRAWSVVVDTAGSAYLAGETYVPELHPPAVGSERPMDVFVAKLDPAGTNLIFRTFLGGVGDDVALDLALTPAGEIWLTGATLSKDFPISADALYPSLHATDQFGSVYDAFITRLSANGSSLRYSTFLGGAGNDNGISLALDGEGNVLVAGFTESNDDFPTSGVATKYGGGSSDAFVTKLAADGSQLLYSLFLGGNNSDRAEAIAVTAAGEAVVAGWTASGDFPVTTNALMPEYRGSPADGFITKLSADGATRIFSTYLGGDKDDRIQGLALDALDNVYVTGYTASQNFPTNQALVSTNAGNNDAFVAKLEARGTNLLYSTYLGGKAADEGWSVAVDDAGRAWVVGYTYSTNFPTVDPVQTDPGGTADDAFVCALDAAGANLIFSSYLGGTFSDEALAVALDRRGSAYVTGVTYSTNFPGLADLPGLPATNAIAGDAFIVKLFPGTARLRAELSGADQVTLYWPADLTGFKLEAADVLGDAAVWVTVPGAPIVILGEYAITLPATAGRSYFRLRR
jgi:hypothetical protein